LRTERRFLSRHCEERSDAAIQSHKLGKNWIASSQGLLAMTGEEPEQNKKSRETSMPSSTLFKGIISGNRRRSFAEVTERADRIAGGLSRLGVKPGDSVSILMRNDIAFIEVVYAVARLGAYGVPVNWHFKPEEITYVIADSGSRVVIAHADMLHQLRDAVPAGIVALSVPTPPEIIANYKVDPTRTGAPQGAIELETWLAKQASYDGPAVPQPHNMIYTSGTTGHPKGVRRFAPTPAQAASADQMRARVYGLKEGARALLPGPLYHSAPNAFALRAGRLGGALVMMPRFEPEEFLRVVQDEKIDTIFMVPTMFIRLMKLPVEVRARYDVSSLRHVIHAAAPCPPDVKKAMIDWWGPLIYEFYGSTESGAVTFANSEDALKKPGTVGKIADGAELRFLGDDGEILPQGAIGEIYSRISGNPDFTYHNKPEKRAEIDRDGFITSGDVGYIDEDGYVFICDRKRDMVISGGVNIYPAEIESALHAVPGVHDCVVFGIPDEEFGESLMAVIEPQPGVVLDLALVRSQLKRQLADYKVPKQIEIQSNLPREDSGKIFKRRLRDPYWARAGRSI
jgi:long-chain acyl-CoA synthetase